MKRFKHILATTDLSSESMSAVQYAAHLAQAQNARLTVLHVAHSLSLAYAEFVPPVSMADIDLAIEKSAREELEKWVRSHLKKVPRVDAVVRRGVTHEVIADVAEEIGASVVVVATHGRKGVGRMVLGSVAEQVIRHAPCPVLVVKPPAPPKRKKKVVRKKKPARK
jgi:nucleotide-binding universal stress UspA family protein